MMEVTSAIKPTSGSAFSIDSIMSKDRDTSSATAGTSYGSSSRISPVDSRIPSLEARSISLVSVSAQGASSTVTSSCSCPVSSELSINTTSHIRSPSHHSHPSHHPTGHHSPPHGSPVAEGHHHLPHSLPQAFVPLQSNALHSSLPLSASEAALMHNRAAAVAAAAAHSAQTLHSQAAMASLSALDPHASAAAALTGGVGTIPSLPSFASLGHGNDRGLAALQALSHKIQGLPPSMGMPGSGGLMAPHHHGLHNGLGNGLGGGLAGLASKINPFYSWFSRPGSYWPHRLPGSEPSFLLPFRKPKRIRTAFSPSQLLRLEHAFEKNHYVVGQERKDLASSLNLTETQVKVWFQNRRTKYKRVRAEEEGLPIPDEIEVDDEPDSDPDDI